MRKLLLASLFSVGLLAQTPITGNIIGGTGSSGFVNPMTTAGDIIVGGVSGSPSRLGIGSNGQVLTVSSGTLAWVTPSGSSTPGVNTQLLASNGSGGFSTVNANANNGGITIGSTSTPGAPTNGLALSGTLDLTNEGTTITSNPVFSGTTLGWKIGLYSNVYALGVANDTLALKSTQWVSLFNGVPANNATTGTPDTLASISLGNSTAGSPSAQGVRLSANNLVFNDNSTTASGTATTMAFSGFASPSLTATNTLVTTTNAANVYIGGGVRCGTNETCTNSAGLFVDTVVLTNTTNGYGAIFKSPTGATNNYAALFVPSSSSYITANVTGFPSGWVNSFNFDNLLSSLNGGDPNTIKQNLGTQIYAYASSAGATIPSSATTYEAGAVQGALTSASVTTNNVAGSFFALASGPGTGTSSAQKVRLWGLNTLTQDGLNIASPFSHVYLLNEYDFNVAGSDTTVLGSSIGGVWTSQPASSLGYVVNSTGHGFLWDVGFYTFDGAATVGLELGALGTGNNVASQPGRFVSRNSGGTTFIGDIHTDANGNIILIPAITNYTSQFINAPALNVGGLGLSLTPSATGAFFSQSANTITDTGTAGSGTLTLAAANSIGWNTLTATNSSITTTDAASLYIAGPIKGGTNETLTRAEGLLIASQALTNTGQGFALRALAPTGATTNYSGFFSGGLFNITGNYSYRPADGGSLTLFTPGTLTDSITAASGNSGTQTTFQFNRATFAAANTNVAIGTAVGLYVAGPPTSGTNIASVGTAYGILVVSNSVSAVTTNAYGMFLNAPTGATNNYAFGFNGNATFNGVFQNWTNSQGSARTLLTNDGSGNLTWGNGNLSATSSSIGGSLLVVGTPVTTTVTVTGAATGNGCLAGPSAGNSLIAGTFVDCYVSSTNTVTLRLNGIIAVTPASQTYVVRVFL